MAGGVAVFDYNNDGKLDIFFANGADIKTLHKDSPRYSNRLFENDGHGHFSDVTEKAGLAGTGFDVGVAIGDYDNDGCEDIFVAGVHRNTLYHNNCNGSSGYASSSAGPVHFGLGKYASADLVEIHWPSGIVQTLHDVPADQMLTVKEPTK